MADRTCDRCGKRFPLPCRLKAHLARKTPCAPILEAQDLPPERLEDPDLDKKQCRFCGRVFTTYTSMRRHVRTACRIPPNERNGDAGMELLYKHTVAQQQKQTEALTEQVSKMATMLQQLAPAPTAPAATTNSGEIAVQGDQNEVKVDNSKHQDNSQDNSQHITINVFGQERLDHITRDQVHQILTGAKGFALSNAAVQAVLQAAMLAYRDPAHPENLTCYLPNKKKNDALVHGGAGWEIQPVQLVLPPMMQKSVDLLFDKQPMDPEQHDLETCGAVLKELEACERDPGKTKQLTGTDGALRAVLVRNKDQLARILEGLPVAGGA